MKHMILKTYDIHFFIELILPQYRYGIKGENKRGKWKFLFGLIVVIMWLFFWATTCHKPRGILLKNSFAGTSYERRKFII